MPDAIKIANAKNSVQKENSVGKAFFQPKLSINQPKDKYEQEADITADKVMRMNNAATSNLFFKPSISSVQRKCDHCEEEEKKMQRKENTNDLKVSSFAENYINSLSGGSPLRESEREFFELGMGHDFNNVRIHNNGDAAKSADDLSALAYTTGNNIVFAEAQYQPETNTGKKLLAHELTHVVQQATSQTAIQRQVPESSAPSSPDSTSGLLNDDPDLRSLVTHSQSLLERYTSEPQRPPVPTFEAITGSVQGYSSYGRMSSHIPGAWSRRNLSFTDTARAVTGEPARRGDRDTVREGTHSVATGQPSYLPRKAIVFSAWNYATWSDVPFVREIIRAGSPFQNALQSEYGQITNVENPTGTAIRSDIQAQINTLQTELIPGRIAELMIYFEGHGGAGGICGVDNQAQNACVDFPELQAFAHTAADAGIHVTFILDSCNIGELVNLAQRDQTSSLETRMNGDTAPASPEATQVLSDTRRLLNNIIPLGHNINTIYSLRSQLTAPVRQNTILPLTLDMFSNLFDLYSFFEFDAAERLTHKSELSNRLSSAQDAVMDVSTHAFAYFTVADITRMRNRIAPFIDVANLQTNELLQQLERLVPLAPQPASQPQIVPDHNATQTNEGVIV